MSAQRQRRKRREDSEEASLASEEMSTASESSKAGNDAYFSEEPSRDVTAEEILEITDDKAIIDTEDELAKKAVLEEWDLYMKDFVPDDMLTFELGPREELVSKRIHSTHTFYLCFSPSMRTRHLKKR